MITKILEMIEGVDPNDTETLDEIDARVWCWLRGLKFHSFKNAKKNELFATNGLGNKLSCGPFNEKYTRSRDALKSIRPEAYAFNMEESLADKTFRCQMFIGDGRTYSRYLKSGWFESEELAELHAILQAIAHERGEE